MELNYYDINENLEQFPSAFNYHYWSSNKEEFNKCLERWKNQYERLEEIKKNIYERLKWSLFQGH